ncbi:WD40 repeat domain-containing protein [Zobellia uliginosa]|uniref:WD40 repeat domain-containing protein n=1 Tax=Zobellia uliginosa TaxID=143224 RepID=UPI001C067A39|nr:hypothetical protein [Zobellia uliginosa]MBU2948892.1 hypothetical protein [Zobellia uliginosa]
MKNKIIILFFTIILSACGNDNEVQEELELQPPTINITSPENDTEFNLGDEIIFQGNLNDTEDVTSELELLISSNIQENITTNISINNNAFSLTISDLIEGVHILTFTVIDSDQMQNSYNITTNLLPLSEPVFFQIGDKITGNSRYVETSADGDIIAILDGDNTSVRVRTYVNENSVWTTTSANDIIANDLGKKNSSLSMSQNGKFLAVGSSNRGFNNPDPDLMGIGIVRVFENVNGQWIQVGDDLKTGNELDGFGRGARGNGTDLSADGSIIAIGAPDFYGSGNFDDDFGLVRVFKNNGGMWEQMGSDIIGDLNTSTGAGVSLSEDGLTMAVGASRYQNSTGQVKVYRFESNDWVQIGNEINGEAEVELVGITLSLSGDGNRLALSTLTQDRTMGYLKVFENINDNWVQLGETIRSDGGIFNFGIRIGLSSDGSALATISVTAAEIYKVTDNSIDRLDIEIGNPSGGITDMRLSSDGSRIIVKNTSEIFVYDIGEFTTAD